MIKFLLYSSLQYIIFSFVKMPFFTFYNPPSNNISESSYIKYFEDNNIYSHLILGTPPQKIVSQINFNEYSFNIYSNRCCVPSEFNSDDPKSTTQKDLGFLLTDVYVDTFLTEDVFSLPETNNNKSFILSYIYAPMNNNEFEMGIERYPFTCANIGLKLSSDTMEQFKYNFLRELKALDIIDNYVFYIEYNNTNNDEGNLIIGKKPHEFDDKYKSYQFREVYAINMKVELYWMMRFDSIYFKIKKDESFQNINLTSNFDATIEHNLNIIIGTYEFMELIEKEFFEEKIKKEICKKNYLLKDMINYECDILPEIENFPTLYFEHKNLLYVFEINFEDIFIKYDGKYICLIWFDMKNKDKWRLGKSFLKKYLFIFDLDKKTIGFYNTNIPDKIDPVYEEDNNNMKYIIIIVIALAIIAFVLCYLLAKYIYNNRKLKKKVMELTSMDVAPLC